MRYEIEKTESGKFNAVMINPSFGYRTVFTFDSKEDAEYFLKQNKEESESRLSEVVTISDYFSSNN